MHYEMQECVKNKSDQQINILTRLEHQILLPQPSPLVRRVNTSPTLARRTIQSGDVDPRCLRRVEVSSSVRVKVSSEQFQACRTGFINCRWIRTVPGLDRPIPTFSTVAAADRKCGPLCVLRWTTTGWTSGSRHTSRKHDWNFKNQGDGHALGPTIAALMNIQSWKIQRTEQTDI